MNENANVGHAGQHSLVNASSRVASATDQPQRPSIGLKPVRLSAFQKELEEAANEPISIQSIKHKLIDESESETQDSEDDSSECKDSEKNVSPEAKQNSAPKQSFMFLTPNANNKEPKTKYAQTLTQINEFSARNQTVGSLRTPINKVYRIPAVTYSERSACQTEERRLTNNSGKNLLHDAIDGVSGRSPQDNVPSVKKSLHYNHFVTPTVNRLQSFNTPRTLNQEKPPSSVTIKRTPGGRTTYAKGSFLNSEKKFLESTKSATTDKRIRTKSEVIEKVDNKENVTNNKIQWSGQVENLVQQFEKLTVGKVEYIVLNQLGRGGSSVVYNCYDPVGKLERAVKKVSLTGERMCVEGYINEVKMLHKLQDCDRIIKMYSYEIIKDEKVLYMVLEKGERDLSGILKDLATNTKHLPVYMLIYYWMEMLYAVKQIHENGIIHSDLKPANFLSASSGLKLIDFGIASSMQADVTHVVKSVQIGSFNYISPEALRNNSHEAGTAEFKISYKSDVWSLGCILYQLVYRRTPFQHIGHTYAKLSAIQDPEQKISYPVADWVPPNIISTVKACLQYNMRSRPSIAELIKEYENIYY